MKKLLLILLFVYSCQDEGSEPFTCQCEEIIYKFERLDPNPEYELIQVERKKIAGCLEEVSLEKISENVFRQVNCKY